MKQYDIVFLNETKFDRYTSSSFYQNNYYDIIRRDRDFNDDQSGSKGGGIIIFVEKYYKVKFIKSLDVEFTLEKFAFHWFELTFICNWRYKFGSVEGKCKIYKFKRTLITRFYN